MQEKQDDLDFVKLYGESINEALSVLGRPIVRVINLRLLEKYTIRLNDTYDKPHILTDVLKSTIDGGTRVIQRRILRILYEKLGIKPSFVISMDFEEKILDARKIYTHRKENL